MKKKLSCLVAICMSISCIVNTFAFAAAGDANQTGGEGYTIDLGKEVEFNRVQLLWDREFKGDVSVDIADGVTLEGKADGTSVNLLNKKVDETTSQNTYYEMQSFELSEVTTDSITVHAKKQPIVRLYKDENLQSSIKQESIDSSKKLNNAERLFDGNIIKDNTDPESADDNPRADLGSVASEADVVSNYVSAELNDVYNISEVVMYTWGLNGWYPKNYEIFIGNSLTECKTEVPSVSDEGKSLYPNYNPYILPTELNAASDSFTITFPEGGYSDLLKDDEGQKKYGFRIFEIELYGSKAPVWTDAEYDSVHTYTFDNKAAEKINLVCEGINDTTFVKVNGGDNFIPVRLTDGCGTITLAEGTEVSKVEVMRTGNMYPGVELTASKEFSGEGVSVTDSGKINVPEDYNTNGTKNGQVVLGPADRDVRAFFDGGGEKEVEEECPLKGEVLDSLGKKVIFYWDKYPEGYTGTKDFKDCSADFTIDIGNSYNISKVELFVQNGTQSDNDRLYITDNTEEYGFGYSFITGKESLTYAVDNAKYGEEKTKIIAIDNIKIITTEPNKKGQYIKLHMEGNTSNSMTIAEMVITIDDVITSEDAAPAKEINPLTAYNIDLKGVKKFNRVQLTWDEEQQGEVSVELIDGETVEKLEGTVDGKVLDLFTKSSVAEDAENSKAQTFTPRKEFSADSIKILSDNEPSVKLYNDVNLRENITITDKSQKLNYAERLFDGIIDNKDARADFTPVEKKDDVVPNYVSANLGGIYNISEFVMYTWGIDGWYPQEYKITTNSTEIFANQTEDPTKTNYPNYNPYILKHDINAAIDSFTITFPKGGYSDILKPDTYIDKDTGEEKVQPKYGFRIFEIELYGSKEPVWQSLADEDNLKKYKDDNFIVGDLPEEVDAVKIVAKNANDSGIAIVKINDDGELISVPVNKGVGTYTLAEPKEVTSVSVSKINGNYPDVQLIKNVELKGQVGDVGKRTVPTESNPEKNRNGEDVLDTSNTKTESLFDKNGTTTVGEEILKNLGKKIMIYWDKYPSEGYTGTKDFTDCSAWFTIDVEESAAITSVKLMMPNGSFSSDDKIFVTNDMDNYGDAFTVTKDNSTKYAYDNDLHDDNTVMSTDNVTMIAEPNKKGQYIKVELHGAIDNALTIYEMVINAEKVVASTIALDDDEQPTSKDKLTISKNGSELTATATLVEEVHTPYTAILALYNKEGALVGITTSEVTTAPENNTLTLTLNDAAEYDKAVLFRWDSLTGMVPVANALPASK